jgi:hypothetical protein
MSAEPLSRNQRTALLSLAIVVGLTRFLALSFGPWDWDEVLFCLAVGDYNVAWHQPHPAGFPLFVLLAKFARLFADSDFHALQAVNVVASLFVFPVMFAVARAFRFDFIPSIAAALLFAFMPNVWFYGGTAFSDPLGAVMFLAAIAAYLQAGTDTRRYLLASVLLAAGVLVRPQNAVVAMFPWTLATVRLLRARRFRVAIAGTLVLVLLVAIGYGIAAYASGFEAYVLSIRGHSHQVTLADTVVNDGRPPLFEVLKMQVNPFDSAKVALALNLLALIAIVFGRRRVVAEVLLTFVPFFVFCMLAANPAGSSRFSLNYLAGIVLLAVEGTDVLARVVLRARIAVSTGATGSQPVDGLITHRSSIVVAVHAVVVAILLGRLITWGWPAFATPRATHAPPTAAAMWLNEHVPPTATIFVDGSARPWVRYFAPRHPTVIVNSIAAVLAHPDAAHAWYVQIGAPPPSNAVAFVRPRNRTWNLVTKRGFEAFVQPTSELVEFGDGWHGLEGEGATLWRWSKGRAFMNLGPTDTPRELRLRFHAPKPVRVTVTLNEQPLGTIVAQENNDLRYVVRGHADRKNVLRIDVSETFVPARSGDSNDTRELGIMLTGWVWRRV